MVAQLTQEATAMFARVPGRQTAPLIAVENPSANANVRAKAILRPVRSFIDQLCPLGRRRAKKVWDSGNDRTTPLDWRNIARALMLPQYVVDVGGWLAFDKHLTLSVAGCDRKFASLS